MKTIILLLIGFVLAVLFIANASVDDDTIIELSDDEAEEYRSKLIDKQDKDVELDKE